MKQVGLLPLLFVLLCLSHSSIAQQSVGIGTNTPNPNAVLQLVSPGQNQGFLLPKLTTAQITTLGGTLGTADIGLQVYDSVLQHIRYWNGAAWLTINTSSSVGTVTSVGLSLPGIFNVSGSPVTTSGILNATLANQAQNTFFAGPTTGSAAPTFRSLVAGDIPVLDAAVIASGTFPIIRGGTNGVAAPTAGAVAYGTGTAYAFTSAGISGQILQSNGAAAPSWVSIPAFLSPTLSSGQLFIGNGSNVATGVAMSGDAGISNTGLLTIQPNAITSAKILDGEIVNADVNASAAIEGTKVNPDFGAQNVIGNSMRVTAFSPVGPQQGMYMQWNRSLGDGESWILNQRGGGGANAGIRFGDVSSTNVVTEWLRIIHNGNVGIGTSTPAARLDVAGTNSLAISALADKTASGGIGISSTVTGTGGTDAIGIQTDITATGAGTHYGLIANVGGSSTNLGIVGNATGGTNAYGVTGSATGATNNWAGYFQNGNFYIGGKLAVGATPVFGTLNQVLTSDASGNISWSNAAIGWGLAGNTLSGGEKLGSTNGNPLTFITNNADRMTITPSGNIGIGTTVPQNRLQIGNQLGLITANVADFGAFVRNIYIDNADNPFYINNGHANVLYMGDNSIELALHPSGTANAALGSPTRNLVIDQNGIGLNTNSPNYPAHLITNNPSYGYVHESGGIRIGTYINATGGWFGTQSNHDLRFFTNDNTGNLLIQTGTGNVGIATMNPQERLDIIGNLRFSQALMPNGVAGSAGEVLTSQGPGVAPVWSPAGGSGWGLTGNAGTIPATNFIGTTDAQNLIFKTDGIERLRINQVAGSNAVVATAITASGAGQNAYALEGSAMNASTLGANVGVYGSSQGGAGAQGLLGAAFGGPTTWGVYGIGYAATNNAYGVYGQTIGTSPNSYGVYGSSDNGGTNSYAVYGLSFGNAATNYGIYGIAVNGTTNWAGFFGAGDVHISNGLSLGTPGTFGSSGQVLTSQGPGVAPIWSPAGGSGWGFSGNNLTGTETLGSNNNFPVIFTTNGIERMRITETGNVGIGTPSPTGRLGISGGEFQIENLGQGLRHFSGPVSVGSNVDATSGWLGTFSNSPLNIFTNGLPTMTLLPTGNVGIGTSTPSSTLDVNGLTSTSGLNVVNIAQINGVHVGQGFTFGQQNTAVGIQSQQTSTGINNTAFGFFTLYGTTGSNNVAVGINAMRLSPSGSDNTGIGDRALQAIASGSNTGIGAQALKNTDAGSNNTSLGAFTGLANVTGNQNTLIGANADVLVNNLNNATAIGYNAKVGSSNSLVLGGTGADAVKVGIGTITPLSLLQVGAKLSIFTDPTTPQEIIANNVYNDGTDFRYVTTNPASALTLGNERVGLFTFPIGTAGGILAGTPSMRFNLTTLGLGIQVDNPQEILHVNGATMLNPIAVPGTTTDRLYNVGGNLFWNGTNISSGTSGWGLGGTAGTVDGIPGIGTNYIGTTDNLPLNFMVNNTRAGRLNPALPTTTFFGISSGQNNTGVSNTGLGYFALAQNTTGAGNTAVGTSSLANSNGNDNTAVGNGALFNHSTGNGNSAFGQGALSNSINASGNTAMGNVSLLFTTGQNNTALGGSSGVTNTTGNNNTFLGYQADATANNLTNATAIGYNAKVAASNSLVLGGTGVDAVNVGIGTSTPNALLTIHPSSGASSAIIKSTTASAALTLDADASSFAALDFATNGVDRFGVGVFGGDFYIDQTGVDRRLTIQNTTGFVGVGDVIPLSRLHVEEAITASNQFVIRGINTFTGTADGVGVYGQSTSGPANWGIGVVGRGNYIGVEALAGAGALAAFRAQGFGADAGHFLGNVQISTGYMELLSIAAPGTTTDRLYNVGGNLFWNGTNISSGSSGWGLTGNTLTGTERLGSDNAQPLVFETNNTEAMRIDAFGNLGIGTAAPTVALSVAGPVAVDFAGANIGDIDNSLVFGQGFSGEGIGSKRNAGTGQFGLDFYTASANRMHISNTGSVGIGTNAPGGDRLRVVDAGNFNLYNGTFSVFANNFSQGVGIGYAGIQAVGTNPSQDLFLNSKGAGNISMQVSGTTGNVGIGTATPAARLDVGGNVANNLQAIFARGVADPNFYLRAKNANGALQATFGLEYTGGADNASINFYRGGLSTDGYLALSTQGIDRMTVNTIGNVGIGTPTPIERLHVNGNTFFQNDIRFAQELNHLIKVADRTGASETGTALSIIGSNGGSGGFGVSGGPVTIQGGDAYNIGGTGSGGNVFITGGGNYGSTDNPGSIVMSTRIGTTTNERMRILGNGNVGIGTSSPGALLDVVGAANGIRVNSWLSAGSSVCGIGYVGTNLYRNASDNVWRFTNSNGTIGGTAINFNDCSGTPNQISFVRALGPSTANAIATVVESMRIDQNGRVGIGTTAPQAPLDVTFTQNIFLSPTGSTFFNSFNGGTLSCCGNPTPSVAVRATGAFLSIGTGEGAGYYVQSDERIKRMVGLSDSHNDLSTLMKVKITDYRYTDSLSAGNIQVKGVFAQQVEEVYPQAVSKQTNFIPNVYALAFELAYDESKQTLKVTMNKPHELVVGDKVKLISKTSGEKPCTITAVAGNSFTVNGWTEQSDKVFVYGKEVNDFRIVDYDRLFTLNLSATQELVKMLDEQKKVIDELKAKEEGNRKRIEGLEASLTKVETEKEELSKLKSEVDKIKAALGIEIEAAIKKDEEKR
jgi:hypothetical protein